MEIPCSKDLFSFQTVTKCQCFPLPAKKPAFDEMGSVSGAKRGCSSRAVGGPWGREGQRSYFHPSPLRRLQIISAAASAEGPELPKCRRFQRRRVMKGRLLVAAWVPSLRVAGPALFIPGCPGSGCQPLVCTAAGQGWQRQCRAPWEVSNQSVLLLP